MKPCHVAKLLVNRVRYLEVALFKMEVNLFMVKFYGIQNDSTFAIFAKSIFPNKLLQGRPTIVFGGNFIVAVFVFSVNRSVLNNFECVTIQFHYQFFGIYPKF